MASWIQQRVYDAKGVIPAMGALLLSCGAQPQPIDPAFDPQLIAVDHGSPSTRFDSRAGSLLLGEGWGPLEHGKLETDKRIGFAWVISSDATASVRFERPPAATLDFVARCLPFTFEGAPQRTLTATVGGRNFLTTALSDGWQLIRAPLPSAALAPGINILKVSFGEAKKPSEVGLAPNDHRRLSAACRFLGIVPRPVDDAEAFFEVSQLDRRSRLLRLPLGGSATVPLPAGSEGALRLGSIRS